MFNKILEEYIYINTDKIYNDINNKILKLERKKYVLPFFFNIKKTVISNSYNLKSFSILSLISFPS